MTFEEISAELAVAFAQEAMQKASYEIGDLINRWPSELRVFFLASAQTIITSLLRTLDAKDLAVFNNLIQNTTTVILPPAFDPRRSDDEQ